MRNLIYVMLLMIAGCNTGATPDPVVEMETSAGTLVIELYREKAPVTVDNFLRYVETGALEGATFYRSTRPDNDPMITVIQGGLMTPWLEGGDEDFTAPFPPVQHETTEQSDLTHTDGVISMARLEPGTASSEFFISVGDNPSLDFGGARNPDGQGFAAFGKVIEGMEIVRAVHQAPTQEGEGFTGQLLTEPVKIVSVRRQKEK